MRKQMFGLTLVLVAACGEARTNATDGSGTTGGKGGESMSGGAGGAGDAGGVGNEGGAGSGQECVVGEPPVDAVRLSINLTVGSANGYVFVESVEPQVLQLVDETGAHLSLTASPSFSFEGISVGTRFWLTARGREVRANPYNGYYAASFSLRTDENGPVLLAALEKTSEGANELLGVPLSFAPLCEDRRRLDRQAGGEVCLLNTYVFSGTIATEPPLTLLPGTRISVTINDEAYDVTLFAASYWTYSSYQCAPPDSYTQPWPQFTAVAQNFRELSANLPVDTAKLPTCRMGAAAPLFDLDLEQLDWSRPAGIPMEFAVSPVSTTSDTVTFSSDYGLVAVGSLPPDAPAVLQRARWLSRSYTWYLLRESQSGRALALSFSGSTIGQFNALAASSNMLGSTIALAPRCEWQSRGCSNGGGDEPFSLYDVIYGGDPNQRFAAPEQSIVTLGAGKFHADVWANPSCGDDPMISATFVAVD